LRRCRWHLGAIDLWPAIFSGAAAQQPQKLSSYENTCAVLLTTYKAQSRKGAHAGEEPVSPSQGFGRLFALRPRAALRLPRRAEFSTWAVVVAPSGNGRAQWGGALRVYAGTEYGVRGAWEAGEGGRSAGCAVQGEPFSGRTCTAWPVVFAGRRVVERSQRSSGVLSTLTPGGAAAAAYPGLWCWRLSAFGARHGLRCPQQTMG